MEICKKLSITRKIITPIATMHFTLSFFVCKFMSKDYLYRETKKWSDDDKLTRKSNSMNGYIVAEYYRVTINSVMRSSTNSEDPWTEGRHALR